SNDSIEYFTCLLENFFEKSERSHDQILENRSSFLDKVSDRIFDKSSRSSQSTKHSLEKVSSRILFKALYEIFSILAESIRQQLVDFLDVSTQTSNIPIKYILNGFRGFDNSSQSSLNSCLFFILFIYLTGNMSKEPSNSLTNSIQSLNGLFL